MTKAAERKNELIISALISTPTVHAASELCGVSESVIYARLRTPEFKQRYEEAKRDLLAQTTAFIQGIVGEAIQKMRDIMNDPDAAPQVQLNAADAIARHTLKFTEQADIMAQLAELKQMVFTDE